MEFFDDAGPFPGLDDHDIQYYDYQSPNEEDVDYEDFFNSNMMSPFSFNEILEHCIEPTLTDGLKYIGKIIAWCLVFRIVTQSCK